MGLATLSNLGVSYIHEFYKEYFLGVVQEVTDMLTQTLTIRVDYLQGPSAWEQRATRVLVNGEEVPHHVAVEALLATAQPYTPRVKEPE